jgi:hypothetical protein
MLISFSLLYKFQLIDNDYDDISAGTNESDDDGDDDDDHNDDDDDFI